MRRRGDELDVELAPSKRLINCSLTPYFLNNSHYIRTSSDTTISVSLLFKTKFYFLFIAGT